MFKNMSSSNPMFRNSPFQAQQVQMGVGQEKMTVAGTISKTVIMAAILFLTVGYVLTGNLNPTSLGGLSIAAMIGGLILALITVFKPTAAKITAPLYAVCQGLLLGAIALFTEQYYPGIPKQALLATMAVFAVMLFGYRSRIIVVTEKLKATIFFAIIGIGVMYLVSFILSFFGVSLLPQTGPMAIVIYGFVAVVAAFSLLLDFDMIENGAAQGAPKYMEWFGAFSLTVTLIWLYMTLVRLLIAIQGNRE